jgi:hypothetical protein
MGLVGIAEPTVGIGVGCDIVPGELVSAIKRIMWGGCRAEQV